MPELPEVETTRRGLAPHVAGAVVSRVVVRNPNLRWPVPDRLARELPGQTIRRIERRAKYLLFRADGGTLIAHLGMSGSLCVVDAGTPAGPHDHVDIVLADRVAVRLTDPRRFGSMHWTTDDPHQHQLLNRLGPEPLTDGFRADRLYERSRGRTVAIKGFLMDNHTVVGVGNIYASESLFMAGIDPRRGAGRIGLARYRRLVAAVNTVLAAAIEAGGTTLRDFKGGDGRPGYFQQTLSVYGREGLPCPACGTAVAQIKQGQRATFYCRRCQR